MQATSQDGFEVTLESTYIQRVALGYYAGSRESVREDFLSNALGELVARIYPDWRSHVIPPPEGKFPAYVILADLGSTPIESKNDISGLVLCWFVNDLHTPVPQLLTRVISSFNWGEHAKDGMY